jgi:hypothetical protein
MHKTRNGLEKMLTVIQQHQCPPGGQMTDEMLVEGLRSIERAGLKAQRRGYRRWHLSLVPKWGQLDHPHAIGLRRDRSCHRLQTKPGACPTDTRQGEQAGFSQQLVQFVELPGASYGSRLVTSGSASRDRS